MVITDQNNVMASNANRIIINDSVNYFLGLVNNDWNTTANWSLGFLPTMTQSAIIAATCIVSSNTNTIVKDLIVYNGITLTALSGINFVVNGTLQNYGTINYGGNFTLSNTLTSWINQGQFNYTVGVSQYVNVNCNMNFPANLTLPTLAGIQNTWNLTGDIAIMGNYLPNQSALELGAYNFVIYGSFTAANGSLKKQSGIGSTIIVGKVTIISNTGRFIGASVGNATIELRGGLDMPIGSGNNGAVPINNDFTLLFSTKDQVFNLGQFNSFACTAIVSAGINLAINDGNLIPINTLQSNNPLYACGIFLRKNFDGVDSDSAIIVNTQEAQPVFLNPSTKPMQTAGTIIIINTTEKVNWGFYQDIGSPATFIHSYYGSTFDNLYLTTQATNDGTLSFIPNRDIVINSNIDIRGIAILDMGAYNFTNNGTTNINYSIQINPNRYNIIKGNGSVTNIWVFKGLVTAGRNSFSLSSANTTIEIQCGMTLDSLDIGNPGTGYEWNFGNGTIKFTTRNQTINFNYYVVTMGSILIDDGIEVTFVSATPDVSNTATKVLITSSINGVSSTSKFISKCIILYRGTADYMTTGIIDLTSNNNTFTYQNNAAVSVKAGTYWNLCFRLTNGSTLVNRTMTGDLVVLGDYSQLANNTLIMATYNLSVAGVSQINGILNKTGSGNLLFIGASSIVGVPALGTLAVVEFRGGLINSGATGVWGSVVKFTTNNQNLTWNNTSQPANFLIGSNIAVTFISSSGSLIIVGSLNGENANSSFIHTGVIDFRNTGTLMATGKFYTDTATNTVIYNTTLAQNIRIPDDGNYRTLTLTGNPSTKNVGGTGGTVNVRGAYTKNTGVTVVGIITNNS